MISGKTWVRLQCLQDIEASAIITYVFYNVLFHLSGDILLNDIYTLRYVPKTSSEEIIKLSNNLLKKKQQPEKHINYEEKRGR